MNFGKFIRKLSSDTENENSSNRSSIISGTSKLFDSVNSKTTNLVSGLSSTFEQIKRRTSVDKESSKFDENPSTESVDCKPAYQDAKSYLEQANQMHDTPPRQQATAAHNDNVASPSRKCPPPKPPPPLSKQMSTPHEEDRTQGRETFSRSQTLVERHYIDEVIDHEYLTKEGGQLANDVLEEAKSHLEMECQKIVSALDDLMSSEPKVRESIPEIVSNELSEQQREFLDFFVSDIYREGIAQNDETALFKYRKCVQTQCGRIWIAKLFEKYQHLNSKEVPETIFYRLLQVFTVVLLECHENGDYIPARDLMLVAFSCYATIRTLNKKRTYNFYLSSFISCHPIWKSIEFWNVCFSNAVLEVRSKRAAGRRDSTNSSDADGVAFHQLQVHLNYMRSLGLPVDLCSGFVRKQVNVVHLSDDETTRLKELMESWTV